MASPSPPRIRHGRRRGSIVMLRRSASKKTITAPRSLLPTETFLSKRTLALPAVSWGSKREPLRRCAPGARGLCLKVCWGGTLEKARCGASRLSPHVSPSRSYGSAGLGSGQSVDLTRWPTSFPRPPALTSLAQLSVSEPSRLAAAARAALAVCASLRRRVVVMAALSEAFLSLDTTTPSPPRSRRSNPLVFGLQVAI